MRKFSDLAYDDEELYDHSKGMGPNYEPPEYPVGMQFSIGKDDADKADAIGEPGSTMRFAAMGTVTNIFKGIKDSRIELELTQFAGEDGQFFDLSAPVSICMCGAELQKLGLEADCERGDMLHLIGTVRLENMSSTEFMGDMVTLQVIEATFEDESEESREG